MHIQVYIYICMYVYIYIYAYTYIHISINMYTTNNVLVSCTHRLAEKGFTNGDIRGVLTAVNQVWEQIQKTKNIQQPLQIFSNETIDSLVASPPATHGNTLSHNATHCNTLVAPWVRKDSTCAAGGGGDVGSSGGSGGCGEGGPAQGCVGISGTKGKEVKASLAANAEPRDSGVADPVVATAADGDDKAHVAANATAASDEQLRRGGDVEGEGAQPSVSSQEGTKKEPPDLPSLLAEEEELEWLCPVTEESLAVCESFLISKKIRTRDEWRVWAKSKSNQVEKKRGGWPLNIVEHFASGGLTLRIAALHNVRSKEKEELDGGASALRWQFSKVIPLLLCYIQPLRI